MHIFFFLFSSADADGCVAFVLSEMGTGAQKRPDCLNTWLGAGGYTCSLKPSWAHWAWTTGRTRAGQAGLSAGAAVLVRQDWSGPVRRTNGIDRPDDSRLANPNIRSTLLTLPYVLCIVIQRTVT